MTLFQVLLVGLVVLAIPVIFFAGVVIAAIVIAKAVAEAVGRGLNW